MFLLIAHACEIPRFMASLTLILLGRTLESFQVDCVTTFGASVPVIVCTLGIKLLLLHLWFVTVTALVLVVSLFGLPKWSFFLYLLAGNSVHWCLSKLICAACGSPATCFIWCVVALELSNFLASCCTLLAGNFSRSTLPSLMVLETDSSSLRKKNKKCPCEGSLQFQGGTGLS